MFNSTSKRVFDISSLDSSILFWNSGLIFFNIIICFARAVSIISEISSLLSVKIIDAKSSKTSFFDNLEKLL